MHYKQDFVLTLKVQIIMLHVLLCYHFLVAILQERGDNIMWLRIAGRWPDAHMCGCPEKLGFVLIAFISFYCLFSVLQIHKIFKCNKLIDRTDKIGTGGCRVRKREKREQHICTMLINNNIMPSTNIPDDFDTIT